jgi:putative methionine-R-sulfoxide reductase with GAF domain
VFAVLAESAARLCDANDSTILQVSGDFLHLVAHHGPLPSLPLGGNTFPLARGLVTGRAILDRRTVQVADLPAETDEFPEGSDIARRLGFHTNLAVPLIRADEAIGVINIRRTEVRPFTDRQIDLLKTFAHQAVIAKRSFLVSASDSVAARTVSDTGEVRVTAKAVNGHFTVSVMDTGPGIPEKHQARIFEQFHQVDSSNTKAKGGTGLGLAIAKQIVEMHGGRIWVESMLGRGSTFRMELPTRAEFPNTVP